MNLNPLRFALGTAGLLFLAIGVAGIFFPWETRESVPVAEEIPAPESDGRSAPRNAPPGRLSEIMREPDTAQRNSRWHDWFDADPAGAARVLAKMAKRESGNPARWHDLMSRLAARWMHADADAALEWMHSLPDGPARMAVEIQCAHRWTEVDPEAAAGYAFGRDNPALHETVIGKWAELDPGAAMSWAVNFAKQRPESGAISQAAAVWAQSDPKAAASFAETLEELETRRRAHVSIVTSWAMIDPEASFEWAETIADAESREAAAERAAEAWIQSDPPAARRRIETSSLPGPVRDRFLAMGFP